MRKIIVIGGSAGGIQSLCTVLAGLPRDFAAALLAVIHTSERTSSLPEVLQRCGVPEVVASARPEPLKAGRLYLPAPNRHLVVKAHCAMSWMGPRENRQRPAVDTLFRSAAREYRSRVIAVILSGALDDGSAGALAVKARGGTVIVQDPDEAQMPEMPANVLCQVKTDHCLPLADLVPLLAKLVAESSPMKLSRASPKKCEGVGLEFELGQMDLPGLTCPECGGMLKQLHAGNGVQFRCHVGHSFSPGSLSDAHTDALERALWVALRRLNEQRTIMGKLAQRELEDPSLKKRYAENASAAERDIGLLHEVLSGL